jgi:hypothetical protein
MPDGRVLVAFDDGPLVAAPTWTRLDDTDNLVAGIDINRGKQTLLDRTDTGAATVYLNDTTGLFDPANTSSPYFGLLDGKQILLQLWNPVTSEWKPQFRGTIDDYGYQINDATGPDGKPIVANIQVDCVDVFDYLGGYGLTPGLDGVTPPSGSEGSIFYAATTGTVDGRIVEVLTDVGIDSTMYVVFTGNVKVQSVLYDADEAALTVLRDAADAELPNIANIYVDKQGRFVFHGRESRFDPVTVWTGIAGTDAGRDAVWRFRQWKVGDGAAIAADSERAQVRVLAYSRARSNIINAAIAYPKYGDGEVTFTEADIPDQAYVDAASILAYGKHALTPLSDLLVLEGSTTGNDAKAETALYAKLYVENQKDPRVSIQTLTLKAIRPDDPRASSTWGVLCGADISDIVNVSVGYPGGVGIQDDDYYVEGVTMQIRPLNPDHDYVELDLEVSPAEWSMDTHGVFA